MKTILNLFGVPLYGLSAYDADNELIDETSYAYPTLPVAKFFAKRYKKVKCADAVEIHIHGSYVSEV